MDVGRITGHREDTLINDVKQDIAALRAMTVKELKARYLDLFGEQSPSSNRQHLFRRIAWRLQAVKHGALSERARERASELAKLADMRLRAPRSFWKEMETRSQTRVDPRVPPIGTIITRTYGGQSLKVEVLENGFAYNGCKYQSLSAVAHVVTGTRWNGFAFFHLQQEQNAR
jgi:Protein of unknown function (DUF2924)